MEFEIWDAYSPMGEIHLPGSNVSGIIDRMVRLAAKLTDRYASDIIYDAEYLMKCVSENETTDFILGFYESGIHRLPVRDGKVEWETCNGSHIQTWRVTYSPQDGGTMRRVQGVADLGLGNGYQYL